MRLSSKFDRASNENVHGVPTSTGAARIQRRQQEQPHPAPSPAARNLALAHHIDRLINREVIADYTQAARMLGVSQPRMSHLMSLLMLAPVIQEAILQGDVSLRDKELRELARVAEWQTQESSI